MSDDDLIGAPVVTENGDEYLTIRKAAEISHKAENTIRYWIDQGLLPTYQRGYAPRPRYIKRSELEELIKMRPISQPSSPSDPNIELSE